MTSRRVPAGLVLAGAVAMILSLAGCTGEPTPTPQSSESFHGLPEGVTPPSEVPAEVPNDAADRLDVAITACEETDSGWRAAGTVTNPADGAVTYEITVFFTTDGGTVIEFGTVRTPVAAGETADWEIAPEFTAANPTLCVLRGAASV